MEGLEGDHSDDDECLFEAAAGFLASAVTSGDKRFDDQTKLAFYGLYKQATCGKCTTSKPGFWDPAGRAKWDAWNKLGDLDKETAMQQYVEKLSQVAPEWAGSTGGGKSSRPKGGMGPVFSCLAAADEPGQHGGPQTLHELAGQGDLAGVTRLLASGTSVDERDDMGCTALHFAADRGQTALAQALLDAGADINTQDEEGQTPLHYAAVTEQRQVFELLVKAGADSTICDSQGQTPIDAAPASWQAGS